MQNLYLKAERKERIVIMIENTFMNFIYKMYNICTSTNIASEIWIKFMSTIGITF